MIRTQISLPQDDYDAAKLEAKRLGISLAEFVRHSLRAMLPAKQEAPWMRYCGLIETGNSRSSQEIDELIYGHKE